MNIWRGWHNNNRALTLNKEWSKRVKVWGKGAELCSEGRSLLEYSKRVFAEAEEIAAKKLKLFEENEESLEQDDRQCRERQFAHLASYGADTGFSLAGISDRLFDHELHEHCTKIRADIKKLQQQNIQLISEGVKLREKSETRRADGEKLCASANKLWAEAVHSRFGDIAVKWEEDGSCTLENGEVYRIGTLKQRNLPQAKESSMPSLNDALRIMAENPEAYRNIAPFSSINEALQIVETFEPLTNAALNEPLPSLAMSTLRVLKVSWERVADAVQYLDAHLPAGDRRRARIAKMKSVLQGMNVIK